MRHARGDREQLRRQVHGRGHSLRSSPNEGRQWRGNAPIGCGASWCQDEAPRAGGTPEPNQNQQAITTAEAKELALHSEIEEADTAEVLALNDLLELQERTEKVKLQP